MRSIRDRRPNYRVSARQRALLKTDLGWGMTPEKALRVLTASDFPKRRPWNNIQQDMEAEY
jgi:hypothetical protein